MKLGILTFHCAHNYGAVFQTLGLQEYLKSLGHDVYVIDYRPKYLVNAYPRPSWRNWVARHPKNQIRKLLDTFYLQPSRKKRWDGFDRFIHTRFNLYPYTEGMDFSEFDAIFLGSDQIWNARITGGTYDEVYFGTNARCKVISYAASSKLISLTQKDKIFLEGHLDKICAVSVREDNLKSLLQPLSSKEIFITIDPTLLAGKKVFEKIADDIASLKRYVLVYEIDQHRETREFAERIANQIGAEIVELVAYLKRSNSTGINGVATPENFISLVKNAECVVTTSFHGTALSIIFEVPFYTLRQHTAADMRYESLLTRLSLLERLIEMADTPNFEAIDYSSVASLLENEVAKSRKFIDISLQR